MSGRAPHDAYPTPAWCVHRLLDRVTLPSGAWLEPCAGHGSIIRAVATRRRDVAWHTIEVRPECRTSLEGMAASVVIGDFRTRTPKRRYAAVVTNPPYRFGYEFLQHALRFADVVVMLLRLNFLSSVERAPFLRENMPNTYVLPNRPSFRGQGTDSTDYGWFVWGTRSATQPATVEVLDTTPAHARKRQSVA